MYHCAQVETRQHKPKKGVRDGAKPRDKGAMDTFSCKGWLHITVYEGSPSVEIRLKHEDEHIPYWCIDVPPKIREFVEQHHQLNSIQVCHLIYL
jgi:hypothetical protein